LGKLLKRKKLKKKVSAGVDSEKKVTVDLPDDVELSAKTENGKKGTDNSSSVPPVKKVKEKYGSNEAVWTVDEQGRPISVEAKLDSTYNTSRSTSEKNLQGSVGGDARLADDDGGHLVGHRFMSDQGEKNLFPQNANLNRSAYKKMENEWADWTDEGFEVKLKVELDPPGSDRPTDIFSKYEVIDPKTKKAVFKREHSFANTAGESFNRVSKSDMRNYK
jgi:hypothetical protein